MPILQNPNHEAFAVARVRGACLEDAYEDAGFVPHASHACRLAKRVEVAERMAELRREQAEAEDASAEGIIAALVRMAKDCGSLKTPAATKEARLNLLEAHRLRAEMAEGRHHDRSALSRDFSV